MDNSSPARACRVHGPVTPIRSGKRLRCPECGVFLRKDPETAMVAARVPPGEGIGGILRRIELREAVIVARRRISAPEWAALEDVVDYRVALRGLELVEARAMDMEMAELERIVPIVLERARRATGIPDLCQTIRSLRGEASALDRQVSRLRSEASAEEARLRALHKAHEDIRDRLAELSRKTNLSTEQILLRLCQYDIFQQDVARLQGWYAQLHQACGWLSAQHAELQRQIEDARGELKRLKMACEGPYNELANLLAPEDLSYLAAVWQVKNGGAASAPPDNTTRWVAKWIADLMRGETRLLEMPHRGPDGGLSPGNRGMVLVDRLRVALSRADRELLARLIAQASHGAEGPIHTIVRILSEKENGEPVPADTGNPDENRRLLEEFDRAHEAISGFLGILDELLDGKRGEILLLPPCPTAEGDCSWYADVRRRVREARVDHLKAQIRVNEIVR